MFLQSHDLKIFQNLLVKFKLSICEAVKIKLLVALEIQYFELLASTRAFSLLTRAFNLPTRVFSLLTRGFELVTYRFKLVTHGFEPRT